MQHFAAPLVFLVIIGLVLAALDARKPRRRACGMHTAWYDPRPPSQEYLPSDLDLGDGRQYFADSTRFTAQPLLVNASERAAWNLLTHTDLGQAHVMAKVRLEDIVEVLTPQREDWMAARGRVRPRHVDFLLVDQAWNPILAVEVDGGSHRDRRRQERDAMVDEALRRGGVNVIHLKVGEDWERQLAPYLGKSNGSF